MVFVCSKHSFLLPVNGAVCLTVAVCFFSTLKILYLFVSPERFLSACLTLLVLDVGVAGT